MNSVASLSGSHRRTYQTIFQHPVSHNLAWRAVRSLLEKLGQLEEEANGSLKVTRNGQSLVLRPPQTKDVAEIEEVMALRHFLERSEPAQPPVVEKEAHWVVVIDHHEARIYRSAVAGAVPQRIQPHLPQEYLRQAHHAKDFSRGKEKPDPISYFEPVAGILNGAGKILIFGSGTGASNEMNQFVTWLKDHRPELAQRIVGAEVINQNHCTEAQLLAKARGFYAQNGAAGEPAT